MQMPSPYILLTVLRGFLTRAGIHERPSRYWDHKASRPDSYGPLTCSEEAVFMKAGQQGPQLSVRVFLSHDLVTDCACVHKEMCSFSTRSRNTLSLGLTVGSWRSFCARFLTTLYTTVTGPRQIGSRSCEDGHISFTLADVAHIYCSLSIFKPRVYQLGCWTCLANTCRCQNTHTLSLFLCVCRGVCVRTSVSTTESLVGMNSSRFGVYFALVPSHLRSACRVATVLFCRSLTFVVTVAEV